MKLKELIDNITLGEVEDALIKNYPDMVDVEPYTDVFLRLSSMEPAESKMRICISWVPPDPRWSDADDVGYWDVHGKDGTLVKESSDFEFFKDNITEEAANAEQSFAIEFTSWDKILGMEIDNETANNIELMKSDIVAHCMWEMTYMGFDEEEVKEKADDLAERVKEVQNMSDEDIKKNSMSVEDVMKKIKEKLNENKKGDDFEEV